MQRHENSVEFCYLLICCNTVGLSNYCLFAFAAQDRQHKGTVFIYNLLVFHSYCKGRVLYHYIIND